jgi:FixJ family two-component response regulator
MTPITIFVIDDDPSVRRAVSRLLRVHGYSVRVFASADEYLAYTGDDIPACLVIDVRMPGKTGLDLFETLNETGADLPVIFITGHGDVPGAVRTMKRGAVDYLCKPFDDRHLLDAIQRGLQRFPRRATFER